MIVYFATYQPWEVSRFCAYFSVSLLNSFTAQSIGLVIGIVFKLEVSPFVILSMLDQRQSFVFFSVGIGFYGACFDGVLRHFQRLFRVYEYIAGVAEMALLST